MEGLKRLVRSVLRAINSRGEVPIPTHSKPDLVVYTPDLLYDIERDVLQTLTSEQIDALKRLNAMTLPVSEEDRAVPRRK